MIGTTANGAAFSAGGVSSTLRDLARYGMLFTDAVRAEGDPAISDAYMEKIQVSGRPELTLEDPDTWPRTALGDDSFKHNSYQGHRDVGRPLLQEWLRGAGPVRRP